MRLRETIKIDEKEYVVRELTLREIINYFQSTTAKADEIVKADDAVEGAATDTFTYLKGEIQNLLDLALESNHEVEDFISMAPSELKKIYEKFKEVNEVFFDIAARMGLDKALEGVVGSIRTEFSALLVHSSKAAMQKSLTTVTPISSKQ